MASLNSVAFDELGPPPLSTKNSSSSVCPGDPLLCGGGGWGGQEVYSHI